MVARRGWIGGGSMLEAKRIGVILAGSMLIGGLLVATLLALRASHPPTGNFLRGWETARWGGNPVPDFVWIQAAPEQRLAALEYALDGQAELVVILGDWPDDAASHGMARVLDRYEATHCPGCPPVILQRKFLPGPGRHPHRQYTPLDPAVYDATPVSWGFWPAASDGLPWQASCAENPPIPALPGEAVPALPVIIAARWFDPQHASCDLNRLLAQFRPPACDQPSPPAPETKLPLAQATLDLSQPLWLSPHPAHFSLLPLQRFTDAPMESARTVFQALVVIAPPREKRLVETLFTASRDLMRHGNVAPGWAYFVVWMLASLTLGLISFARWRFPTKSGTIPR